MLNAVLSSAATLVGYGATPPELGDKLAEFRHGGQAQGSAFMHENVPFLHQPHINQCADACMNMLKQFHGKPPDDLSSNSRGVLEGLDSDQVLAHMAAAGLERAPLMLPFSRHWQPDKLRRALAEHGPVQCSISNTGGLTYHSVLLVGVNEKEVLLHDPWGKGPTTMPLTEFEGKLDWTDPTCMLAFELPKAAAEPAARPASTRARIDSLMRNQSAAG
ncbi:papain-like cysteine protease family protein [Rugamonas sp. CCM 8940]|uniref:papain-like cysteine protease family protein n=1 Tax=Rugamonas sp. CCM 8940 TaxID=2765359 RepID=UPI0018F7C3F8|nr:papain-like cysteine protease family protein [Rugamonas sp. CCM 8940]MBJ7311923.1 hypothetical protein [Rugamonas sp. CCM 8940]